MSRAAYEGLWLSSVTAGKLHDGTSYKSTTTSTFLRLLLIASFDAVFPVVTA